jgi:hypothetical protein
MAYSLGGVVVLFLIGRRLFGDRVGLYAALLLAVFPGDVLFATQLMPDIGVPFFLGLSVLLFLKGESASGSREATRYYGLCGVAVAGAFLCRVTAVYHLLFYAPFLFPRRRFRRGTWLIFCAFAAALGLLYFFYYLKTGDLLYELTLLKKIRESSGKIGYILPPQFTRNLAYMVPIIRSQAQQLDLYAFAGSIRLASPYLFGFFYYFIIPCFLYWTFRLRREPRPAVQDPAAGGRRKAAEPAGFGARWDALLSAPPLVPVLWLFLTYLAGEYGTVSLSQYQQLAKQPRFLLVQTMPGLLLVALWIDRMIHGGGQGGDPGRPPHASRLTVACGAGALLFLVVTSVLVARGEAAGSREHIAPYRAAYAVLKDRPNKDLFVVGGWWPLRMSYYLGPENGYRDPADGPGNRLRLLKGLRDVRDVRDAYVVLDRNPFLGVGDFQFSYSDYPPFVERIPSHWQRLGASSHTEVYYAPPEVPPAVAAAYARPPSPGADLSTWEKARAALERAVREKDFDLFRSCLSDRFRSQYGEVQVRSVFDLFLRSPGTIGQMQQRHFFEENGRWRPSFELSQGGAKGGAIEVR